MPFSGRGRLIVLLTFGQRAESLTGSAKVTDGATIVVAGEAGQTPKAKGPASPPGLPHHLAPAALRPELVFFGAFRIVPAAASRYGLVRRWSSGRHLWSDEAL
jgi:hypothetical protein